MIFLPPAHTLERDRAVPLIEQAFEFFRKERILPPTLVQAEKLIWIVLRLAEDHLYTVLTARLTPDQKQRLDALLQNETRLGGHTRLAWLRATTGDPSPKSINKIVERLLFIRELDLPSVPTTLHQNRVLHLARKCSKLSAQPLLKITSRKRRYSLLLTYLHELSQDLTDLALDQFDKRLADLHIREHYTDTGGSTDHVFALTALMGFKFAPRISSSLDRNLYTYQPVGDQGPLNELIASPVRAKYIIEHWEEMQRVASSIRHGSVSASLLMRRLRAYSRQNRLASALTELGKLERTSFLLDYFQDEALHALARQLFSGKHGELWDRAFEDQMHRASCLHLIMAAIATWNAVYLSQAVEELKKRGEGVPEEYLPHITPASMGTYQSHRPIQF